MRLEDVSPRVIEGPGGLRAFGLHLPNVHRAVLWAHVRVGSRFETRATNGISHFLEHMMYRGTRQHPSAQALAFAFERLGGSLVAETGADSGWMAVTVPPEALEAAIAIFSDVFLHPIFTAIDVEKGIVREELLEELDEDGRVIEADSLVRALLFGDHPLGLPIGGDLGSLSTFDTSMLVAHHARHYTAASTVIAVAGPTDVDRALGFVERAFREVPGGARTNPEPPLAPSGPSFRFVRHGSSQTTVRVAFRAPGTLDPLEPATELLLRLIDDGMSTRLYRQLCDEKGLCYDASANYEAYGDVGFFDFAADTEHERASQVLAEVLDVAVRLRDDGPAPGEIDKAKARHRFQLLELLDSPEQLAEHYAEELLTDRVSTLAERREALDALTDEDVRHAAERLFRPENLCAVAVGLQSKAARAALANVVHTFR